VEIRRGGGKPEVGGARTVNSAPDGKETKGAIRLFTQVSTGKQDQNGVKGKGGSNDTSGENRVFCFSETLEKKTARQVAESPLRSTGVI